MNWHVKPLHAAVASQTRQFVKVVRVHSRARWRSRGNTDALVGCDGLCSVTGRDMRCTLTIGVRRGRGLLELARVLVDELMHATAV